jgi:hypothetical protein
MRRSEGRTDRLTDRQTDRQTDRDRENIKLTVAFRAYETEQYGPKGITIAKSTISTAQYFAVQTSVKMTRD